jgi:very-short-patch-repair endonuclease
MEYQHNKNLVSFAKQLRKNMTKEERHLWYDFLRDYHIKFYRQRVIGNYIVDFYCAEVKLVVEVDGGQHYDDVILKADAERTAFLESCGLTVIRIPNNEINENFEKICDYIDTIVGQPLSQLR